MFTTLLKKVFGSANDRLVKKHRKTIEEINAFESHIQKLSDTALREKTAEFKQRLASGETLGQILPEAFAVVREASTRNIKNAPF